MNCAEGTSRINQKGIMMKPRQSETKRRLAEEATALFNEFRNAYANEWRRQEHNERMYRGEHWYDVPVTDPNEPRPVTPILQSRSKT